MTTTIATVTNLALYRKRKLAQERGRALWALYANGGAPPSVQRQLTVKDDASRQA